MHYINRSAAAFFETIDLTSSLNVSKCPGTGDGDKEKKKLGRGSINSPLYNGGSMNLHVRPIVNPLNLRAASHVIEIVLVAL